MSRADIHPVMVGTAGHIDHGKSSLVRALTGIDPDRLKEEKERGLTIDLGFAPLRLSDGRLMGMIDVPGHERFVRNMVAGSTSLDLAILVVAADDGVMPQTIEHLDILDLLGVRRGVVALTKVDAVDEETAALAEADVVDHLQGRGLQDAQIVRVSNLTGVGLDQLRAVLEKLATAVTPRSHEGPFRMPIQRVFQLHGIGTVVTGVPVAGELTTGMPVEFLPGGELAKVRAIQAFGGRVDRAVAGHSTALSVPDAREAGLHRGMVVATPGVFRVGDAIDVELQLLPRARPIHHRRPVRFHTGTVEAQGELLLLDREILDRGEVAVSRIELEQQVCCAPDDRFLLRLQNPPITVGGGRVLRVLEAPGRYRRAVVGVELEGLVAAGSRPDARVLEELKNAGPAGLTIAELAGRLGVDATAVEGVVSQLPDVVLAQRANRAFLQSVLAAGTAELLDSVQRMLRDKPLAAAVKRASIRTTRSLPPELLDLILDQLQREGRVRTGTHGRVLFLDRLQPLSEADQKRLDQLVLHCEQATFRPPARAELTTLLGWRADVLDGLIARALDEGRLDEVGEHLYAARTMQKALQAIRRNCLRHAEVLEIPELRDELGTSRKYLIPLLEHVDSLGLTRLRGGVRVLLPSSAVCRELAALDASG